MPISLNLLKKHMNLTEDEYVDDELLRLYLDSADMVVRYKIDSTTLPESGELSAPLVLAVLMTAAHLFQNREAVGPQAFVMPMAVDMLTELHKGWFAS